MRNLRIAFLFVGTGGISLLLYILTLAPAVGDGDTAELQRVASTMALPHPTGYPLYILLGHVWISLLPFGNIAWRMNLLSAVFAALAVGFSSVLIYRLTNRLSIAILTSLLIATASSFWSDAVVAEVYSLHALFVSLILFVLLSGYVRHPFILPATSLLTGLGFAHHRMIILLFPGLAFYFFFNRSTLLRISMRHVCLTAVAFVLGISPYVFTYLKAGSPPLSAFLPYVFHSGEAWIHFDNPLEYFAGTIWPFLLLQQISVFGLLLGLIGLAYAFAHKGSRQDSLAMPFLLGLSWLASLFFFEVYRVGDIVAFVPPYQVINGIMIGLGLTCLLSRLENGRSTRHRLAIQVVAFVLLASALALQAQDSWRINDQSSESGNADKALAVLRKIPRGAVLFSSDWGLGQTMLYEHEIENYRPDLTIIEADRQAGFAAAQPFLEANRPVYFYGPGWLDLQAPPGYQLFSVEASVYERWLNRLVRSDLLANSPMQNISLGKSITQGLVLESVAISPSPLQAGQVGQLRLCWSGEKSELNGRQAALEVDGPRKWLNQGFVLGDQLDPSGCTTRFFMVPPAPFTNTGVAKIRFFRDGGSGPESEIAVGSISVVASPEDDSVKPLGSRDQHPPDLQIAGAKLIGLRNDASTSPGITFPLIAYWQVSGPVVPQAQIELRLEDASGSVATKQMSLVTPSYPSDHWPANSIIASRYEISVPHMADPGTYLIKLAVPSTGQVEKAGSIQIEDLVRRWQQPAIQYPTMFDFANGRIQLLGYGIATTPRDIDVTLYWKSVDPVNEDWKVFVHVIDSSGKLVAQSDSIPGNGLHWTDAWKPGEYVVDQHSIEMPGNLNADQYAVLVGMYDPKNGTRVPIHTTPGSTNDIDAVRLTAVDLPQSSDK